MAKMHYDGMVAMKRVRRASPAEAAQADEKRRHDAKKRAAVRRLKSNIDVSEEAKDQHNERLLLKKKVGGAMQFRRDVPITMPRLAFLERPMED